MFRTDTVFEVFETTQSHDLTVHERLCDAVRRANRLARNLPADEKAIVAKTSIRNPMRSETVRRIHGLSRTTTV